MNTQENRSQERRIQSLAMASTTTAAVVAAVNLTILLGYLLRHDALRTLFTGMLPTNPVTAIVFLCAAAAVILYRFRAARHARGAGAALGGIVFAAGALKLAGYVLDVDMHFDLTLFGDQLYDSSRGLYLRIAPITATCLALLGGAIILHFRESAARAAHAFAAIAFFLSYLAITGYALHVTDRVGLAPLVPMALPSALSTMLLSIALLTANAGSGLMRPVNAESEAGALLRATIPVTVLIPPIVGVLLSSGNELGWYSAEYALSRSITANVVIVTVLVWATGALLHRAHEDMRTASEALDEETRMSLSMLSRIGEGVARTDTEGAIQYWNSVLADICGLGQKDVLGRQPWRITGLFSPNDAEKVAALFVAVREERRVRSADGVAILRDGKATPVNAVAFPIIDGARKLTGVALVFRSVPTPSYP